MPKRDELKEPTRWVTARIAAEHHGVSTDVEELE
jgi:hypothetical protein